MRPLSEKLGVEIRGVDLTDMDDATFAKVKEAFDVHGVVVLPGQELTPEQLRDFGKRFGPLRPTHCCNTPSPSSRRSTCSPTWRRTASRSAPTMKASAGIPISAIKEKPVMATMLYGIICPPEGGDTLFADMSAAWDALPEERKAALDGKKIQHSYQKWMATRADRAPLTEEQKAKTPTSRTRWSARTPPPAARASSSEPAPSTGWRAYPSPEGKQIVDELVEYATGDEFVLVHKSTEGDVVMWDNRRTLHTGTLFDDTKYQRHVHRMMVQGDVPF